MNREQIAEDLATAAESLLEDVQSVGLVNEDVRTGGAFFDMTFKDGREFTVLVTEVHR